jgi:hypothetical protein
MLWIPKPGALQSKVRSTVNPLAAIPLKPDNVELRRDMAGCLHLRMTPPLKPFQQKVATWLRYDYTRKLTLDEYGEIYYSLIDGQRPLSAIVDELTKQLGKDRNEVAMMVVTFTKMLMTRNMVALKVPAVVTRGGRS